MSLFGWGVLLFGTILASQWFLLKRYGKNWFLTVPGLFLVYHIVFNVSGGVFVVHGLGTAEVRYLFALWLGVVIPTLMPVILDKITGRSLRTDLETYLSAPTSSLGNTLGLRIGFVALAGFSILVAVYYLSLLPTIPLFDIFRDSVETSLAKGRELATTEFEGKYHRYGFYFRFLLPTFALMTLAARLRWKTRFWTIALVVVYSFTAFMQVADVQKMPLINFLGMTVIAMFILRGGIDWKKVVILFLVTIVLLIFMYQFIMGMVNREMGDIIHTIAGRLFLAQTKGMYTAFRVFPGQMDYLLGKSFPNPAGIFPFSSYGLSSLLFSRTFGVHEEIHGTAPTVFYSEFYCNFGYGGMVASILLVSTLLYFFQRFLLQRPKTPLWIGILGFWTLYGSLVSITSIFVVYSILFFVYWFHIAGMRVIHDIADVDLHLIERETHENSHAGSE